MKKKAFLFLLLTFLSISFIYAQNTATKIDDLVAKYNEYGLFNGSVLAAKDGQIVLSKGYGFANYEFDVPNTPETKFRIGSISKQFTAALIMILIDEGKLKLDGKITDYLKDYRKDTGEKVTIKHLLTHTSGIPSYTNNPNVWKDSLKNHYDKEYFIKHFHSGDLQFEPGERFAYNNTGYYLLATIAEEVTGKSFTELINEKIIKPAGLNNTGIEDENEIPIKNMANGYIKKANIIYRDPYLYMPNAMGAGSMYSTVVDMFKWDQVLRSNTLLKKELKEQMFTPYKANYGFGWMIFQKPSDNSKDSITIITHSGGINGFNTIVISVLEDGRYVAAFNNAGNAPLQEIASKIMKLLNGEEVDYPRKPIKDYLLEVIYDEGIETAIENYKQLKKEAPDLFDFSEQQLNTLGYILLNDKRYDEALQIFQLNAEMFPTSSNVYDSMAEAYMKKGDNQKAIELYKKSLELNPANENGKKMLKKLGAEIAEDPITVPADILREYAGKYLLAPNFVIKIRIDKNRIFAQATSQAEFEIFPISESKFYYKVINAQIEFSRDENGKVNKLTLYQNGSVLPAKKLNE